METTWYCAVTLMLASVAFVRRFGHGSITANGVAVGVARGVARGVVKARIAVMAVLLVRNAISF